MLKLRNIFAVQNLLLAAAFIRENASMNLAITRHHPGQYRARVASTCSSSPSPTIHWMSSRKDIDTAFGPLEYDFSSKLGWDNFYKSDGVDSVFEWHSDAVSNDDILDELFLRRGKSTNEDSSQSHLLIGTGNSLLPRILYDKLDGGATVTCLDYSLTCIENLEMVHGVLCPDMKFVHGDATMLTDIFFDDEKATAGGSNGLFDTVIDKGLIDALMCSEGWNGPVTNVVQGVPSVLKKSGMFMLISYKLPNPTKEFIEEISAGRLEWEFDLPRRSTDRVSFSVARRIE